MKTKYKYEDVYNIFLERGFELISKTYKNNKEKLEYRCTCGNISFLSLDNLRKGVTCKKCSIVRGSSKQRNSFEKIFNVFKSKGCELLESEYINAHTNLKYKCHCGSISYATYTNFKNNYNCMQCTKNKKYTYEYVYNYFKEKGCELLETEYINHRTKMRYICVCGNEASIKFYHFKAGHKCAACQTGPNHIHWNPNREEIKLNKRIRKNRSKYWIKTHLKDDQNYNDYLNNPENYHIDHIIPISAFSKILLEQNLDENKIKKIANQKENLQILSIKENMRKNDKFTVEELNNYIKKYYK